MYFRNIVKSSYISRLQMWAICAAVCTRYIAPLRAGSIDQSQPSAVQSGVSNLFKVIDIKRDAVDGNWEFRNGDLVANGSGRTRIEIPFRAPAEYDYKVVFTRHGGAEMAQICQGLGHQFQLTVSCLYDSDYGFELINGKTCDVNPTARHATAWLVNDQQYTSIVKVRKDHVQAYLNGKLITEWKTDYSDMDQPASWALNKKDALGLGCWAGPTYFHSAEVIEINATGAQPSQIADEPKNQETPSGHQQKSVVGDLPLAGQSGTTVAGSQVVGANQGQSPSSQVERILPPTGSQTSPSATSSISSPIARSSTDTVPAARRNISATTTYAAAVAGFTRDYMMTPEYASAQKSTDDANAEFKAAQDAAIAKLKISIPEYEAAKQRKADARNELDAAGVNIGNGDQRSVLAQTIFDADTTISNIEANEANAVANDKACQRAKQKLATSIAALSEQQRLLAEAVKSDPDLSSRRLEEEQRHQAEVQRTNEISLLNVQIATLQKRLTTVRKVMNGGSTEEFDLRNQIANLLQQRSRISKMTPSEYGAAKARQLAADVDRAQANELLDSSDPKVMGGLVCDLLKQKGLIRAAEFVDTFTPNIDNELGLHYKFTFVTQAGFLREHQGYIILAHKHLELIKWERVDVVNIDGDNDIPGPQIVK